MCVCVYVCACVCMHAYVVHVCMTREEPSFSGNCLTTHIHVRVGELLGLFEFANTNCQQQITQTANVRGLVEFSLPHNPFLHQPTCPQQQTRSSVQSTT